MAKKKHFSGVGKEKIHTARDGNCGQGSTCDYRKNADSGPGKSCADQPRQSHHAIPVSTTYCTC